MANNRKASSESQQKFSNQQLSTIEKKLELRAAALLAMKTLANRTAAAEIEVSHPDEMDLASAHETADSARMMAETMRIELLHVQDALQRIRTGRFGVCEDCDAPIPVKRLEIRPEARLCIDCQSEEERHFGRNATGQSRGDLAYAS